MNTINAQLLAKMFLAGAKNLECKKDWLNEMNVFPVPDGDTGTNMSMTVMAAAKEVAAIEDHTMEKVTKAISSGSLRGARGNSGVILSQLFRGFTKVVSETENIEIETMAHALEKAVETAYKAVMKPKEGTILTVAKGASTKARELADSGCTEMDVFLLEVIQHATFVLGQTPEMLPVLKQAGVVDAGGQGFVEVLQGWYDAYTGKEVDYSIEIEYSPTVSHFTTTVVEEDITFGYCTEFFIHLSAVFNHQAEVDFKEYLESIGDSIVVVADDEIVKIHVHTNDPGLAIQRALSYGQLSGLKIDNMRLQHAQNHTPPSFTKEMKKYGFISVSVGAGLDEIFKSLGVDVVIEGGQTMNPSTEDMLHAIEKVDAENIFIFPNNSNIILAANQAMHLTEDKNIIVIPSKTVPQGITALINFAEGLEPSDNEETMVQEIQNVKTGSVTYAVRDTKIDDKEIKIGDYMGIGDSGILSVGREMDEVIFSMVEQMIAEDSELLSIYYGEEITSEHAEQLSAMLEEKYPDLDVDLQDGGQQVYYYIISIE